MKTERVKAYRSGQKCSVHFLPCLFTALALLSSVLVHAQTTEKPNVVYILADDLGIGDVSAFNENSKLKTVHIDNLAAEGMKFTDAHSGSAVCSPTRYGILTGRYSWRSVLKKGVLSGYSNALIEPDRITVADVFQTQGYHTAFVGKWHLGWDWKFRQSTGNIENLNARPEVDFSSPVNNGPKEKGFKYSYGFSGSLDMAPYVYVENGKPTSVPTKSTVSADYKGFWREGPTGDDFVHAEVLQHLTRKAVGYIEEQSANRTPFFLYFALPSPHTPILPSAGYLGKSNTNFYGDFVLETDGVVGQIIDALKKQGVYENTIIIFTSDNGCSPRAEFEELASVGHHPSYIYRGHKADIYEGGHRVPFVVSWPQRIPKGTTSAQTICTTDLMATVADLFGLTLPQDCAEDSFSFLPILLNKAERIHPERGIIHHSVEGRFAIRKDNWKLILWPGSGGWSSPKTGAESEGLPRYQLFDLAVDPGEKNNLVDAQPEKVKELEALFAEYIRNGRSTAGTPQQNDGDKVWTELKGIAGF